MSSRTLLLMDGLTILYRSFHAIRVLATASGRPTNAVFGFVRAVRQLLGTWQPTHAAVAFDGGLPADRMALLAEYKAQRPPMPEDLKVQIPDAMRYLDCAGVSWFRRDAQEADDIIASLTRWARPGAERILIASGDKDFFQLVDEKVQMVTVSGDMRALGPREVAEKTGVPPSLVVEWLALIGDSSDNIPGVPGIGPKTAARLLTEFGSLGALWERAESLSQEKIREALVQNRRTVERNVDLIRLRTNLEEGCDWPDLALRAPDARKLLAFYTEMEFRSLADEMKSPELF